MRPTKLVFGVEQISVCCGLSAWKDAPSVANPLPSLKTCWALELASLRWPQTL